MLSENIWHFSEARKLQRDVKLNELFVNSAALTISTHGPQLYGAYLLKSSCTARHILIVNK